MLTGYSFTVTCPECGGELTHQRSVVCAPDRGYAEVFCPVCVRDWTVHVGLTPVEMYGQQLRAEASEQSRRNRAAAALDDDVMGLFS